MMHLSASSIKDYLECRKKYWYRINKPDSGLDNEYLLVGRVVHELIEKHWNDDFPPLDHYKFMYGLDDFLIEKINGYFFNFKRFFRPLLSNTNTFEKFFKQNYTKDVLIVGKYDCITENNVVIDWKTSSKIPASISNDVQFILYYQSYFNEYKVYPDLYFASLYNGRLIKYIDNPSVRRELYEQVIPNTINYIKAGMFPRTGLYTSKCFNCVYKVECHKEMAES